MTPRRYEGGNRTDEQGGRYENFQTCWLFFYKEEIVGAFIVIVSGALLANTEALTK